MLLASPAASCIVASIVCLSDRGFATIVKRQGTEATVPQGAWPERGSDILNGTHGPSYDLFESLQSTQHSAHLRMETVQAVRKLALPRRQSSPGVWLVVRWRGVCAEKHPPASAVARTRGPIAPHSNASRPFGRRNVHVQSFARTRRQCIGFVIKFSKNMSNEGGLWMTCAHTHVHEGSQHPQH